jgi:hypothetical protein
MPRLRKPLPPHRHHQFGDVALRQGCRIMRDVTVPYPGPTTGTGGLALLKLWAKNRVGVERIEISRIGRGLKSLAPLLEPILAVGLSSSSTEVQNAALTFIRHIDEKMWTPSGRKLVEQCSNPVCGRKEAQR